MRGPFEVLGDLYDYNYQYYRWFMFRRLLFSELSFDSVKSQLKYNIFTHKDYENVGSLVKQTGLIGFGLGVGLAPIKYASLTDLKKYTFRQALPATLGVLALCTGVGVVYGAIVNATAKYRGKKNDHVNHAVATLATFPVMGVYAKTNKIQWGILNSIVAAGVISYLKYSYSGNFMGVDAAQQPNKVYIGSMASHYKP